MPTIKRYTNRKLYHHEDRRYVTLEEIGQMVRDGDEIQVVDYATGEDLTNATLLQVLFAEELRDSGGMPPALLTHLMNRGSRSLQEWLRAGQPDAEPFARELNRRAARLVEQGHWSAEEAERVSSELLEAGISEDADAADTPQATSEDIQSLLNEIGRLEQRLNDLGAG
jgi:polyhydroxyalkanoate synthesis repressor PhaR